jgi:hypothetical protein
MKYDERPNINSGSKLLSLRAAQYLRMSTDLQKYSIQNQADAIVEYATRRGLNIVREYADEGRSGLRIGGREALQRLISDVQSGGADFKYILVYDVSRWGRFQDADESAYYEFICKEAGIQVLYCAEQFENDGSVSSTILKSVTRAEGSSLTTADRRKRVGKTVTEVTYYVALPFIVGDDGVAVGEPAECFNPTAVVIRAEALSRKEGHVGAVAFSRTGDPATGDFSDAKVIKKFGDVPDDLSAL